MFHTWIVGLHSHWKDKRMRLLITDSTPPSAHRRTFTWLADPNQCTFWKCNVSNIKNKDWLFLSFARVLFKQYRAPYDIEKCDKERNTCLVYYSNEFVHVHCKFIHVKMWCEFKTAQTLYVICFRVSYLVLFLHFVFA